MDGWMNEWKQAVQKGALENNAAITVKEVLQKGNSLCTQPISLW